MSQGAFGHSWTSLGVVPGDWGGFLGPQVIGVPWVPRLREGSQMGLGCSGASRGLLGLKEMGIPGVQLGVTQVQGKDLPICPAREKSVGQKQSSVMVRCQVSWLPHIQGPPEKWHLWFTESIPSLADI